MIIFLRPDAVENVAVWEDPDVEVWRQDLVESRNLLVPEESVRHPDLPSVGESEVADLVCSSMLTLEMLPRLTFHSCLKFVLEDQSSVVPSLSQSDGEVVFLQFVSLVNNDLIDANPPW